MIYVGLDDFCDEHAAEFEEHLKAILQVYPNFKATLYTIPLKTSNAVLDRWTRDYPCLQYALHGLTHKEGETWFHEYDLCKEIILEHFGRAEKGRCGLHPQFVAGFKAPWWKLGHVAAKAFNDMGYWVATNGTHTVDANQLKMNFDYKTDNHEFAPDLHYYKGEHKFWFGDHYWHGHVQSQRQYNALTPNGIGDVLNTFLRIFRPDSEFGFVNDMFNAAASTN